eukprot:1161017-Pelagomonas_calceolata.AAC.2
MVDASMVSLKPPALAIETNRVRLSHFVIVGRACTGLGETDRIRLLHLLNAGWACSWEEADITRLSLHFNVELLAFETNRVRPSLPSPTLPHRSKPAAHTPATVAVLLVLIDHSFNYSCVAYLMQPRAACSEVHDLADVVKSAGPFSCAAL